MRADEIITTDARSQSALQSRFAKLKSNLVLWSSCISYARRNPQSGCNLQDEIRKAQVLNVAKKKKTFIHFDCWEQVKIIKHLQLPKQILPLLTHIKEVR
ncbi:hypothetical protein QQ045_002309 [Rhodiola kirilowii]